MKIKVYSRGETVFNADDKYQEPMIREAIDQRGDVADVITDYTDTERSDISHDHYAVVTGDDEALVLWRGWLTGDPEAPAPAEADDGGAEAKLTAIRDYLTGRAARFSAEMFPVRAQDMGVSAGAVLAIIDGREPSEED